MYNFSRCSNESVDVTDSVVYRRIVVTLRADLVPSWSVDGGRSRANHIHKNENAYIHRTDETENVSKMSFFGIHLLDFCFCCAKYKLAATRTLSSALAGRTSTHVDYGR